MNELTINNHVVNIVGQFLNLLKEKCKSNRKDYFKNRNYYICTMMNQFTNKYETEYVNKKLMSQEDYKKIYSKVSDIIIFGNVEVIKSLYDDELEKTKNAVRLLGLINTEK